MHRIGNDSFQHQLALVINKQCRFTIPYRSELFIGHEWWSYSLDRPILWHLNPYSKRLFVYTIDLKQIQHERLL